MKPEIPLKKLLRNYYVNQNFETEKKLKIAGQNLSIPDVQLTHAVKYLQSQPQKPRKQIIARAYTIAIGEKRNIDGNTGRGRKKKTRRRKSIKKRSSTKRR